MLRQVVRRSTARLFSSSSSDKTVPAATKQKNAALALALLGAVGGIYYTAINKMKQTDELDSVIAREETRAK